MNFLPSSFFKKRKAFSPQRSIEERERFVWHGLLLATFLLLCAVVGGDAWAYVWVRTTPTPNFLVATSTTAFDEKKLEQITTTCEEEEHVFKELLEHTIVSTDAQNASSSTQKIAPAIVSTSSVERATPLP